MSSINYRNYDETNYLKLKDNLKVGDIFLNSKENTTKVLDVTKHYIHLSTDTVSEYRVHVNVFLDRVLNGSYSDFIHYNLTSLDSNSGITKRYLEQDGTVFHCKTQEESDFITNLAVDLGCHKYKVTWGRLRSKTCYNFKTGNYEKLSYYKSEGFKIVEVGELINNKLNKHEVHRKSSKSGQSGRGLQVPSGAKQVTIGVNSIDNRKGLKPSPKRLRQVKVSKGTRLSSNSGLSV